VQWGTKTIPNTKTTRFEISASVACANDGQGVPMGGKIEMRKERATERCYIHLDQNVHLF